MKPYNQKSLIFIVLILALAGCSSAPIPRTPPATKPGIELTTSKTSELLDTQLPLETNQTSSQPVVVEYNLGDTTITQSMFPEDSRFRNMPVRLNGIVAVPNGDGAPHPVVVILHGNHVGCPVPEGDTVDRWPCDPEVERANYRGFAYLVS